MLVGAAAAHGANGAGAAAAAAAPQWRAGEANRKGVVDLGAIFGERARAVAYAVTEIDSPRERAAEILCGSDDGIALWLNGEQVHAHESARGCAADDDTVRVRLKAGVNRLVAKISNLDGAWGFTARVR